MFWTICVPVPKDSVTIDGNRLICFVVPIPDVLRYIPNHPDPPEFLTHPDFDQEKVRYLQALATIDHFAEKLPAELSRDIQHSVAAHMRSLGEKLGAGVKLSRHQPEGC